MADVFLSYASEDHKLALLLADRLGETGFTVWWDRHIHGGADFSFEIEREIKAAKTVVVLWSQASQGSKWVRDEAAYARDADKLIPLRLDDTLPPFGFRQVQAIDFSRWNGAEDTDPFCALLQSLGHMLDPARTTDASVATPPPPANRSPGSRVRSGAQRWRGLVGLAVATIAVIVIAMGYLNSRLASGPAPIEYGEIEIRPFTAKPPDAERSARAATFADAFRARLTEMGVRTVAPAEGPATRNSELILGGELVGDGDTEILTARLDDRVSGSTLWSLQQAPSAGAAWEANVTGYAVKCALKRRDPKRGAALFSRYLYGCASYLEGDFRSLHAAAKAAYAMVPEDPRAIGFFAVGTIAVGYGASASRAEHQRYMSEARRLAEKALQLDPQNADALFAMGFTYDSPQFAEQERWWRAALEADPETGMGPGRYGNFLAAVGRIREAMDMELRAALERRNKRVARAARLFAAEGDWRQANAMFDLARPFDPTGVARSELQTHVMFGDIDTATQMLKANPELAGRDAACWKLLLAARRKSASFDGNRFAAECGGRFDSTTLFTLAGDVDGAFRELDLLLQSQDLFEPPHLLGSEMAALRRDARFWPLVARMGFTAYWLETERWPDFCSEPPLPVDCRDAARAAQAALPLARSTP